MIGQKSASTKVAATPRRLGVKGARTFAASLAVLSLGGCATWSPDGGFGAVQLVAGQELQKDTTRIRTPEDAAAASDRVQALLAKPLDPETAVQIALLNNRGLQAAYSELGIAEAAMVDSSLPPSPIFSVGRLASSGGVVAEVERMIVVNILALATLPQRSAIARERFRQAQLEAALATLRTAGNARPPRAPAALLELNRMPYFLGADVGSTKTHVLVADETGRLAPEISHEFKRLNRELNAGIPRVEAFQNLGDRAGVDSMKSLCALIIQSDKLGTSIADVLRIYADDLRVKRRQRAEELASKASIKMTFVLVFFVFPSMFIVLLGPMVITVYKTFFEGGA